MPTYVIVGASQGIGFAFCTHLATLSPSNTVFGLVRDLAPLHVKLTSKNITLPNLHFLSADMTSLSDLRSAYKIISQKVSSIDTLIIPGQYQSLPTLPLPPTYYTDEEKAQLLESETNKSLATSVVGVTLCINTFLPLIKQSTAEKGKRIVAITSPKADVEYIKRFGKFSEIPNGIPYSVSKAAMQCLVANFAVELGRSDGILCFSMSPGFVRTEATEIIPQEYLDQIFEIWKKMYPKFEGKAATAEEAVEVMVRSIEGATMEQAGEHLSWRGDTENYV